MIGQVLLQCQHHAVGYDCQKHGIFERSKHRVKENFAMEDYEHIDSPIATKETVDILLQNNKRKAQLYVTIKNKSFKSFTIFVPDSYY